MRYFRFWTGTSRLDATRFVDENDFILKTPFCNGGVYDFYGAINGSKVQYKWFDFPSQMIAEVNQSTISWQNTYPCKLKTPAQSQFIDEVLKFN